MKITGTLNAYLDTSMTFKTVQFLDNLKKGDMSEAIDATALSTYEFSLDGDYVKIGTAVVTVDIEDDADITRKAIETLRARQTDILAKAEAMSTEIDAKIQSLLAIGYEAPASDNTTVVDDQGDRAS